jgi:hypothetical protein
MLVGEKPKKAVVKNPKTKVVNDVMGQILDLTNSLNNGK